MNNTNPELNEKDKNNSKTIAGVLKKPSPENLQKTYKKNIKNEWLLKKDDIDEIDNPVILSALFSSNKKSLNPIENLQYN